MRARSRNIDQWRTKYACDALVTHFMWLMLSLTVKDLTMTGLFYADVFHYLRNNTK